MYEVTIFIRPNEGGVTPDITTATRMWHPSFGARHQPEAFPVSELEDGFAVQRLTQIRLFVDDEGRVHLFDNPALPTTERQG